jgi:putative acetyltransferase
MAWQGRGIGAQLLADALDLADNWLGMLRIKLAVRADNPAAIALYRKFGFRDEGLLRAYACRDGAYTHCLAFYARYGLPDEARLLISFELPNH